MLRWLASLVPRTVLATSLVASVVQPASAQSGPLDGKSFEGTFVEKGKAKGDPDTLVFKDGRFRSTACDRYGYKDAPYTAIVEGDLVRFEAETTSPRYGTLKWSGVIRGARLESTALWLQPGKPTVENIVSATLKQ